MKSRTATKNRSCVGKRAYPTRAKAEAALQKLVAAGTSAERLKVYACRHCSAGFHIGHLGRDRRRQ
ncbi:hypothetical protein Aph01nite_43400 [Acrocarpospora phusangensis]|uniref:Uncharacterized protein n=1 Tax=Acrocarpospora phusangensis TaxID=1070424 RepID=A0A919US17_9ACTN|nr:hypothetical protein [Acrocarpospora phusangensis]GIH26030.1 hypothetical protein Aph01nite_43400 [Acrocarpospora phusangensis]